MKKTAILSIILVLSLFTLTNCDDDKSEVIETLDGEKSTVKKFEQTYETAIESMSRMQNIEKKNLMEIISKDIDELDEQLKPFNYQFQKKNFYENYRNKMMIKLAADKSGFSNRQDIKNILKYVEMETIAQLYMQEQVEKKIKITDEDAQEECKRLRDRDPRVKALTLDRCIQIGRGSLKQQESNTAIPKALERIKEGIAIKHNEKFDLEQYLKSGLPESLKMKDANKPEEKSSSEPAKDVQPK